MSTEGLAAFPRSSRPLQRLLASAPEVVFDLNETLFTSLRQTRAVLAVWQRDYNEVRRSSEKLNRKIEQLELRLEELESGAAKGQAFTTLETMPGSRLVTLS